MGNTNLGRASNLVSLLKEKINIGVGTKILIPFFVGTIIIIAAIIP